MLGAYPVDSIVGHVRGEVIVRRLRMLHTRHTIEDGRGPLVGFTADESIELIEA